MSLILKEIQTALKEQLGILQTITEIHNFLEESGVAIELINLNNIFDLYKNDEIWKYKNKTQVNLRKFRQALVEVGIEPTIGALHDFLHKAAKTCKIDNDDIPILVKLYNNYQFYEQIKKKKPDRRLMEKIIQEVEIDIRSSNTELKNPEYKYLYIVGDEKRGVCKIGITGNLEKRLKNLQGGYPFDLKLMFTVLLDNVEMIEKYVHWVLDDFRLNGEWFYIDAYYLVDWSSLESFRFEQK